MESGRLIDAPNLTGALRPYKIPFSIPEEIFVSKLNKAESARINGAKSRGPVTPEGKQRSSLNAVRHGLLAKSICLTNEDPEKFKELLQDYLDRLQPTDNVELRLVEQVASAAFRLERFAGTETALFDLEMDTQAPQIEKQFKKIDHASCFAMAFKSLADNSKALHLYLRYEATITRQYDRALNQLLALRAKFPVPAETPDNTSEAEIQNEPNDERITTNDEPRASALPNEPTTAEKCCGFNTQGICGLGRKCPDAHLYQKVA